LPIQPIYHLKEGMLRYREEQGEACIDVRTAAIENVFDLRDPAPFRNRDLDPTLRDYLVDSAEDLLSQKGLLIVFWLENPCEMKQLEEPVRAHFSYELERLTRNRLREVRMGFMSLVIAFFLITLFTAASQLVGHQLTSTLGTALKEALIISGWVLLWRPIEVLVYDGLPWRRTRKILNKLIHARIDVRGTSIG
jgi:hypothetical protein